MTTDKQTLITGVTIDTNSPEPIRIAVPHQDATEIVKLSTRYSLEFRFDGINLDVTWLPSMPSVRQMKTLSGKYRKARDAFLGRLDASWGVNERHHEGGA